LQQTRLCRSNGI